MTERIQTPTLEKTGRSMRLFTLALFLSATLLFGPTSRSAEAHARLDRADPGPETTVPTSPAEVRIWFTQELTLHGNELWVADPDGNQLDSGDARVDQNDPNRKQLVVSVPALAPGSYTVNYTSSSADDGHALTDSYRFTVVSTGDEGPSPEDGSS